MNLPHDKGDSWRSEGGGDDPRRDEDCSEPGNCDSQYGLYFQNDWLLLMQQTTGCWVYSSFENLSI